MAKKISINGKPLPDDLPNIPVDKMSEKDRKYMESMGLHDTDQAFDLLEMMGFDIDKMKKAIFENQDYPKDDKEMIEKFYKKDNDDYLRIMEDLEKEGADSKDWNDENFDDEEVLDWFDLDFHTITTVLHDVKPQELHLRIMLKNSPVKVWREIKAPSNLSLEALAVILIYVMGWNNTHMHQFRYKDTFYTSRTKKKDDFGDFADRFRDYNANDFHLGNIFKEKGRRIELQYDFGDSWTHDVWMKGVRDYEPDEKPALKLVNGKGQCPPEDCGGVWGYEDLLNILQKKRKTAEEKERLKWYFIDKDYDPDFFDFEEDILFLEDLWEELQKFHKKLTNK